MINLQKFEKALGLAVFAHRDQFDKAGMPYILHPIRVSEAVNTEDEKIVAVLHDIVEDTDFTSEDVRREFGDLIGNAVDAITKLEKVNGRYESYREYLDRVRANPLALKVKLADMADNSQSSRLASLTVQKQMRLAAKYARGRHYLLTGEWYHNRSLDQVIEDGYRR